MYLPRGVFMQVVVDWLESNAYSNLKRFPEKIHFFADEVTWENTLHKLEHQDPRDGALVTEMVSLEGGTTGEVRGGEGCGQ